MQEKLGPALAGFDEALERFRKHIAAYPDLYATVFDDTEDWTRLLRYKLMPQLADEACLVAAVAGGTNTGKSTVFNVLLGRNVSPVCATAAATCRPLLVANARRAAQCLEGRLLPEFLPIPLDDAEAVIRGDSPENALFVAVDDSLPDRLVLLDIPDVDSIDKQNWEVAENIQAAGDILIAVLTGEKYKDDRVVTFFRRAHAAGRRILPVMNKANPENDYEIARMQLDDFAGEAELIAPEWFVMPHDFSIARNFRRPVPPLQGALPLRAHIEALDVSEIKASVYRDTVRRFVEEAGAFLDRAEELGATLRRIVDGFEDRVHACATAYDPEPGEDVGRMLHEYIKERRGPVGKAFGKVAGYINQGVAPVGRMAMQAVRRRITLEPPPEKLTETELAFRHMSQVKVLARNLAREFIQSGRNLRESAAQLVVKELDRIDVERAVYEIAQKVVKREGMSEAFRAHAQATIEAWWNESALRRQALLEIDTALLIAPTAIAVPLSLYMAGVGVPEVFALAGPVAGEFFSRIMEHQFADKWLDLIGPWRREQQQNFEASLREHIVEPALHGLCSVLEPFEDGALDDMRSYLDLCRKVC
jgi:hypothetical protein